MKDKNFNKIHKLYKDIKSIKLEGGFINVIISIPLKNNMYIGGIDLQLDLERIFKVTLDTEIVSIFTDEIYLNYRVKNEI